jgi:hypothetical protein
MKIFKKYAIIMIAISFLMTGIFGCKNEKNDDTERIGILALLAVADANAAAVAAGKGPSSVALGSADGFVILSKSGVTNVATSAITGNVGTSPIAGSFITGLDCTEVTGTIYSVDGTGPACKVTDATLLTTAVSNMETAYTDAAGRAPDETERAAGTIGGQDFVAGTYKWSSNVLIPSDITLSGGANDRWIFQIAQNLTVSSAVKINLIGGAQAKNIIWQVAGDVTLNSTSEFKGTILGKISINLKTGAKINGRMLAQTEVTLQSNIATKP